jgi:hypothetical protein
MNPVDDFLSRRENLPIPVDALMKSFTFPSIVTWIHHKIAPVLPHRRCSKAIKDTTVHVYRLGSCIPNADEQALCFELFASILDALLAVLLLLWPGPH